MAQTTKPPSTPDAHALLRSAHDAAWRFPEGFGGFSASIEVSASGYIPVRGTIDITGPRAYVLELDAPAELKDWVQQQVASMVGHRWARAYADGDGKYDVVLERDDDPRGPLVRLLNDPFASSYRVHGNAISVVNRTMGSTAFTISTQTHVLASDGRTLPQAFTVAYRDAESNSPQKTEIFTDTYTVVDRIDVPLERRVSIADGNGVTGRQFRLSNVHLH